MATQTGIILTVFGKSSKGHSRIGQHGDRWEITKVQANVHFDTRHGEWALVKSLITGYERWVLLNSDNHFGIIEAEKPNVA